MNFFRLPYVSMSLLFILTASVSVSQSFVENQDWFNQDVEVTGIKGVSADKAYEELLKNKKSSTIIVAVLDNGVDINHEDLQGAIWTNIDEIPDNGIDDDNNGYVDDIHGWNFLGNPDGENVDHDTYEITRLYGELKAKYEGKTKDSISKEERDEFELYQKVKTEYESKVEEMTAQFGEFAQLTAVYKFAQDFFTEKLGKSDFSLQELIAYPAEDEDEENLKEFLINANENDLPGHLKEGNAYFESVLEYHLNPDYNSRTIVNENPSDLYETGYGNNQVYAADPAHGTHVAGIIAANRNNEIGVKGVAANVLIMPVRMVPDGDERDKDVANGIRYAVDNGAKIINMSFGKAYAANPEIVDEAVQYAMDNDVLLVHAAGNSSSNNDKHVVYPNGIFKGSKNVNNWIEVGASSFGEGPEMIGSFTNYGKKSVDIFAPGVDIMSTIPNNEYKANSGTSMAAPVVSGVAALLWSYYPELTAAEVKEILMDSAVKYKKDKTVVPGASDEIKFKKLSLSGGIVNAYNALQEAADAK